ncbi:MAG TPA: hypothetical protein VHV79_14280 [Mycobacteriales bacterium]|jgi:hypothetical protein|nr:hypothetical protein [Mycobacteriales bacterium]
MSASWISDREAAAYGQRTTPSARIWSAHISVFFANPVGRRNVQSADDDSMSRSTRAQNDSGLVPAASADK